MTAVNFNPASDGLSLPIAKFINSHLSNPFYYATWVDASPTRKKIDPIGWFQTHPHPKIWTDELAFALGVATLIDPQFSLASSKVALLENKPSTTYLIVLLDKKVSIQTVVLENTPSGKCVLYYRTNQVLAIREVAFDIFKRDLADMCNITPMRMACDLAFKKYFGSSIPPLELSCCYVPLSYPHLSPLPRWQPYSLKKECLLWYKVAFTISLVFALTFIKKINISFPVKHVQTLQEKILDVSLIAQVCATCTLTIAVSTMIFSLYRRPYQGPYFQLK